MLLLSDHLCGLLCTHCNSTSSLCWGPQDGMQHSGAVEKESKNKLLLLSFSPPLDFSHQHPFKEGSEIEALRYLYLFLIYALSASHSEFLFPPAPGPCIPSISHLHSPQTRGSGWVSLHAAAVSLKHPLQDPSQGFFTN